MQNRLLQQLSGLQLFPRIQNLFWQAELVWLSALPCESDQWNAANIHYRAGLDNIPPGYLLNFYRNDMRELTDRELYQALQYAKSQDENAGRAILQQFHTEQGALAQTIFGVFSALIADKDRHLANLFMDLCFDVICVFRHAFGCLPDQRVLNREWLENTAALLDAELQAFMPGSKMDTKFRDKFQNRFTNRLVDSNSQAGLVKFMDEAISEYIADSPADPEAVRTTRTMMYVVIQLFGAMYEQAERQAKA